MIEVENQYIFSATLGSLQDFIGVNELISFNVEETGGNVPPTFEIDFLTNEDVVISKLNEGSRFIVQFGESIDDYDEIELYVSDFDRIGDGDKFRITASGYTVEPDYNIQPEMAISDKKSGVEVLKEVTSNIFNPVFNIEKSQDMQKWIRYNIPLRKFVNELVSHSYVQNSFLLSAILSNKDFILKDAREESILKSDNPDWIFATQQSDTNVIGYASDFTVSGNPGLINNLVGYGREKIIYEIESGNDEFINKMPEPIIALTKEVARKSSINKKFTGPNFRNDNVHENYHKAYLNFIVNNAMLSSIRINLSFSDKYRNVRPLDWVMFRNDSKQISDYANEYLTGFYIVSKVRKQIMQNEVKTDVTLSRESFNRIKNE